MCENPIYCDACGDCIVCYGEDICPLTKDGKHIPPQEDEPGRDIKGQDRD